MLAQLGVTIGDLALATAVVPVIALDAINLRYPAADPAVADQMAQVREELAAGSGMGS